jgi:plasmid stabilization system protein ParE
MEEQWNVEIARRVEELNSGKVKPFLGKPHAVRSLPSSTAVNPLEIHPEALEEFKSAVMWYRERSEIAARNFVAELDHAVELVTESPERWPSGEHGIRKICPETFSVRDHLPNNRGEDPDSGFAHGHRLPGYWKQGR